MSNDDNNNNNSSNKNNDDSSSSRSASSLNNQSSNRNDGRVNKNRRRSTGTRHAYRQHQARLEEEHRLFAAFAVVAAQQHTNSTVDPGTFLQQESDSVWKLAQAAGVYEGLAAAAFTFWGLNRAPRLWARYAARKHQQQQQQQQQLQQHTYKLDKPTPPTSTSKLSSPFQSANHTNPKQIEQQVIRSRRRFLFTSLELCFDFGMSVGMGLGVGFLCFDYAQVGRILANIPMQPGVSQTSDTICPPLLQEYQKQWNKTATTTTKKDDEKNHDDHENDHDNDNVNYQYNTPLDRRQLLLHPQTQQLELYISLIENCRHRQVMQQQIGSKTIPETGVIPQSDTPLQDMMMMMEHYKQQYGQDWNQFQHLKAHSLLEDDTSLEDLTNGILENRDELAREKEEETKRSRRK